MRASQEAIRGMTDLDRTDPATGLTSAEVEVRTAEGLVNVATVDGRRTVADIVRANVLTRFNAILGTLLVVVLATREYRDALFGLVLVANTLVGIVQELRAKATLDRLHVLTAPMARVRRDGVDVEVDTTAPGGRRSARGGPGRSAPRGRRGRVVYRARDGRVSAHGRSGSGQPGAG